MKSLEEAIPHILQRVHSLPPETIGLLQAQGRVLREEILAPWDFPRFDYSAMDGYAIRAEDLTQASPEQPISLQVSQEIRASDFSKTPISRGECARIFTGAAIPPEANAVILQEDVRRTDDIATFQRPARPTEAIRKQGSDLRQGEVLLPAQVVLRPGEIGLLGSIGRSIVQVTRKPRVALLSCGDELVELYRSPPPGHIIESNRFALAAQIEEAGGIPLLLPLTPDQPERIRAAIEQGLDADIFITSGGASAGDYDLIQPTLREQGVDIHFWKVAIKPGKPLIFGSRDQCLVFGLPGNPISSMMTFELFVRPTIRKLLACSELFRPRTQARLTHPAKPTRTRTHFVRGHFDTQTFPPSFTPYTSQSSGNLLSMRQMNAAAILPPGDKTLPPDTQVEILLFQPNALHTTTWTPPPTTPENTVESLCNKRTSDE